MRSRVCVRAVVVAALVVASACESDEARDRSGSSTTTRPAPSASATTTTAPTTAPTADAVWPVYGHDDANSRLNEAERAVAPETVGDLAKSWSIDGIVGVTGTPAVVDGTAYFADWTGAVHAVSAETGEERWRREVGGQFVAAVAVEGSAVFAANGSTLWRLDRTTGSVEWEARTDDNPYAQISASPVVVDGLVIQGTATFENVINQERYTFRGSIAAFDARTGRRAWKLFTTRNDARSGAGAGVWSTPAIDRDRKVLYVGTGQGLSEPTPPLADSLVAVDYRTGKLRWSQQFTYPDVFSAAHPGGKDADVGASPNLWTVDGRDFVGAGDKGGTFHALDRDSGDVVWETQLTPGSVFGGQIGSSAVVDGMIVATSNVGDPATNAPTDRVRVFGLDPATGAKRWSSRPLPGKVFAPVSAVPGVAFVGTDRGAMLAFDVATGDRLWSYRAPARVSCGPAIVDGRVLWGYGFILFGPSGKGGLLAFEVPG